MSNDTILVRTRANRTRLAALLLGVSLAALASSEAFAANGTDTWNGNTSVNWGDAGNWTGTNTPPITGDDVAIATSGTGSQPSNLNIGITVHSLALDATTNTTANTSGYLIAGGNSLGIQSGGSITDSSGNTGTDKINVGLVLNGPTAITVANGSSLNIGGTIGGSGLITITNHNSTLGTLTFSGTNNDTSGVSISAGSLSVGSNGSLGGGAVSLADGTTLQLTGTDLYLSTLNLTGTATVNTTTGHTATWGGFINGGGTLNVTGGGVLVLTPPNNYTGGTIVQGGGTVSVGADSDFGPSGGLQLGGTGKGTLDATATFTLGTGRAVTLGADGGEIDVSSGQNFEITQGISSGGGSLTVGGTGTLILAGDSGYGGGTTINSGATLQLGDGTNEGSVLNNISNGGTLVFDEGGNVTVGNLISGSGAVTQNDSAAGIVTLTAANTYNGATTITSGTLQLGADGTSGSIANTSGVSIGSAGTLSFNHNNPFTFAPTITGSGVISQDGSGTTTLTGTNSSFTGNIHINAGTLSVVSQANLGDGTGTIAMQNQATLAITGSDTFANGVTIAGTGNIKVSSGQTATFSNPITDGASAGALNLSGGGTLVLTGTNSYSNGTILSGNSTLQLGDGTSGSGSVVGNSTAGIIVGTGSTVAFDHNAPTSYAGAISGGGSLHVEGGSTLTLTGSASLGTTAGNGVTINSGSTLQIGNGGTTGTLAGNVTDSGALVFNTTNSVFFTSGGLGSLSGVGSLTQSGSGTLFLGGTNSSFSGEVDINFGAVSIGSQANLGTGTVVMSGNTTLDITGSDTFSNQLDLNGTSTLNVSAGKTAVWNGLVDDGSASPPGTLAVTGGGTLTLGDNLNTYAGGTTVNKASTLSISDDGDLGTGGGLSLGDSTTKGTLSVTGTTTSSRAITLGTVGGEIDVASSDTYTVSSGITGGALTVGGTGTLLLTGANTNTGTTINSGATVQLGDGTTAGSLTGNISDGGTLAFNSPAAGATVSNAISGTGGISQVGGTTILTGTNTYNGATAITAGTLQIGNGGTSGSIADTSGVSIASGATLDFDHSDSVGFGISITGAGTIEQNGGANSTLTLSADNSTFSGDISIAAGTISVGTQGNLGDGTGTITMAAGTTLAITGTGSFANEVDLNGDPTISVATGQTATWNGLITDGASPPGTLEVTGGGKLVLTDASNSYTGGTVVKGASTLSVGADSDLGVGGGVTLGDATTGGTLETSASFITSRAVTLGTKGGTIQTDSGVTTELGTAVGGTGNLIKTGTGSLVLGANATYSGGTTTISGGTLQLGTGGTSGFVLGNIVDNGALVVDRSDTPTFAGTITGSGSLTVEGLGTLTLTNTDSYNGGTTIASATTLQLGNGTTDGAITGAGGITDNGTLAFDDNGTTTVSAAITGAAGAVSQIGTGTTILTGTDNYGGGTTITQGTLQIGNGGVSGAITGNVSDSGTLAFDRADTVVFSGNITDDTTPGAVQQIGGGTTVLTGTNTYTGGTSIKLGTLQLGNGSTTGSITGAVSDAGTLVFDRSNSYTFSGLISDGLSAGAVKQIGTGTTILTANNTYTGGTTITAGTLQLGDGTSGNGTIAGSVIDGGTLAFDHTGTYTFGGAISGNTGAVTQMGGTTILTANNTFGGGTKINVGTALQLGNGGTTGSITGNVSDAGTLAFDRADTVIFTGVVSDNGTAGALVQEGGVNSVVELTSNNTYTGGTTISSGTLQLGNGGTSGSISNTGGVVDNGALTFDRSDSYTYGGVITGSGAVNQSGTGATTLSGISTYNGATNVTLGTLIVNGSIAHSATNVTGNATLEGIGTVGALTVSGTGHVEPGNGGIGTPLNVQGNLTLGGGSETIIATTPTQTNQLLVSGSGSLGGTLLVTATGTYTAGQQITVLTAASGLTGNFSTFDATGFGINFAPTEAVVGDNVVVTLGPSNVASLLTSSGSTNLNNIVDAINFAIAHDGAAPAFAGLGSLSADQVQAVLYQMDGEVGASVKTVAQHTANAFLTTLLDPNIAGRDGLADGAGVTLAALMPNERLAYDGPDDDVPVEHAPHRLWSVWGDIRGDHNQTGGNLGLGTHDTSASDFGGDVGFNYSPYSGRGAVGVALGYNSTSWNLATAMGKGSASVFQIGAYYSRMFGPNYFSAAGSFADYNVKTDRVVNFGGTNVYEAKFTARSVGGRFEYGHIFDVSPTSQLIPYLNYNAQDLHTPTYAEKTLEGSNSFALGYTEGEHFDYTSELGLGWNAILSSSSDSLTKLRTRLGWEHDYVPQVNDTATFTQFSGATFTVLGSPPAQNSAHLGLGIDHEVDGWSFGLSADGLVAGRAQTYGGTANVAVHW